MRRFWLALVTAGALLVCPTVAAASEGNYVVVYKHSVAAPSTTTGRFEHHFGFASTLHYSRAIKGFAAHLTDAERHALAAETDVAFIQPDITFTAAGLVPLATGETEPVGIRRIGAATTSQVHAPSSAGVAVLDTGIDLANADLNAARGTNCVRPGTSPQDDNGHGTNVAGIIAAKDQGAGVVGVAPATKLYSVKVLGKTGSGTLSQILCGIDWVTANSGQLGIKVVNMSLAGSGINDGNCGHSNNDAEHQAICTSIAAGVTYVAAAGNNGAGLAKYVPAAYPEVLTVTAMTDTDGGPGHLGRASCVRGETDDSYGTYSNYAVSSIDKGHTIAAPGTCVTADKLGGGTSTYYGTSQAAPHVAGAVALCLDDGGVPGPCAGLTPSQIISKTLGDAAGAATTTSGFTGDPLHPVSSRYYGYLLDASAY
ncbi:MAG: S8 family serine peptidase [Solirubrobacteraceae bacterium]